MVPSPLWRQTIERFPFLCLSPPGDRWCDVRGFVPTVSVSSSSTPLIFRDSSHLIVMVALPVSLSALGHTPWLSRVQDSQYIHRNLRRRTLNIVTYASLGFPTELVAMMACMVLLSPLEAIQRGARMTVSTSVIKLDIRGDAMGRTVFVNGAHTLLQSEASPWPVFDDRAISVAMLVS